MSSEIPKTYDPSSIESAANRVWLEERCFAADPAAPGDPYCIVIPPPNVTGALHLGHAINTTLQDILTRAHRMRGFNTVWIPGIDHAGIATQAVVEKQLKEKENKTRHDVGREALVERIWEWKKQFGDRIIEQLKRMGCSCDWDRTRFTLDEQCARAVRETFFKLFKDGLIYRGKRLVNWDVLLQTSISDDEIYHETVKTNLWHIRYPIEGTDKFMVVATTRPETMLGDTAVAVHSEDSRWNWAIGKSVELPLTGRKIPIIADDILVDPKFGSGVVKVTPAHDPNDYAVWQRHKGAIDILNILNPDGTINQNGGTYAGMKRDPARKKIVEDLTALGLLEKEEPYETQVGHSDRSKTPVEPYLSDQWFVKMAPLAEPALQVVREGIIKFFPERHAQQYLSWLGEKRDWPISRQLWWGHRIPVWNFALKAKPQPPEMTRDSRLDPNTAENPEDFPFNECAAQSVFDAQTGKFIFYCCPPPNRPDLEAALTEAGLVQDPDVLDTWFSSALWPHSTLGWPVDTPDLRKWYPTSVLVTSRDIITLWVARMVMTGMYNMGSRDAAKREGIGNPLRTSLHPHHHPRRQGRAHVQIQGQRRRSRRRHRHARGGCAAVYADADGDGNTGCAHAREKGCAGAEYFRQIRYRAEFLQQNLAGREFLRHSKSVDDPARAGE
jgi:valyl-tRNA synthetase